MFPELVAVAVLAVVAPAAACSSSTIKAPRYTPVGAKVALVVVPAGADTQAPADAASPYKLTTYEFVYVAVTELVAMLVEFTVLEAATSTPYTPRYATIVLELPVPDVIDKVTEVSLAVANLYKTTWLVPVFVANAQPAGVVNVPFVTTCNNKRSPAVTPDGNATVGADPFAVAPAATNEIAIILILDYLPLGILPLRRLRQ